MRKFNELANTQQGDIFRIVKDIDKESAIKLYDSIATIISASDEENVRKAFKSLLYKPIYKVQTVYDLLKEFCEIDEILYKEFEEVEKYLGQDIDLFVITNMMN